MRINNGIELPVRRDDLSRAIFSEKHYTARQLRGIWQPYHTVEATRAIDYVEVAPLGKTQQFEARLRRQPQYRTVIAYSQHLAPFCYKPRELRH